MSELFDQWEQDKELLMQQMVNVFLKAEEEKDASFQTIMDMLIADGYDEEEIIQEIVNRATNQGQSENACVRIIGEDMPIDFEDINKNLPLAPIKIAKKGDKYRFVTAENDYLLYEIEKKEGENILSNTNALLDSFLPYKDYMCDISQKYYLGLRLSLSSDFAQMYCLLTHEIMRKIAELNLNLEISILSFGGVIDIKDEDNE